MRSSKSMGLTPPPNFVVAYEGEAVLTLSRWWVQGMPISSQTLSR